MKAAILFTFVLCSGARLLQAQGPLVPAIVGNSSNPKSAVIPQLLVYRHFLAWVNDLDNKAAKAGASDPHEFAKPFKRAQLESSDLDAVLREAKTLDSDLTKHDAKAKTIINEYRHRAQRIVQSGGSLPPAPPELHQLQVARTAILIQHMVNLQSALGAAKSAQLNAYLQHEIMPHVSLKPLLHSPVSPAAAAQSSLVQRQ